jgi:hypothetical protein
MPKIAIGTINIAVGCWLQDDEPGSKHNQSAISPSTRETISKVGKVWKLG